MTESRPSATLCRYFMHGACREGDNCKYSHDRSSKPSMVCRFYMKGQCTYGDTCRYDHVKASPKSSLTGLIGESSKSTGAKVAPKPIPLGCSPSQKSNMVSLKKGKAPEAAKKTTSIGKEPEEWVKAKEFVPGQRYEGAVPGSYAKAASLGPQADMEERENVPPEGAEAFPSSGDEYVLCPFAAQTGACKLGESCTYLHGDYCDICFLPVLHPYDLEQQEQHKAECMAALEQDMEHSFAVQRSQDKQCSICMELVLEKEPPNRRRFGIMPNCNHCFCLSCIREWRSKTDYESTLVRSCPECRIKSDFVAPSLYWVDTEDDKKKLIEGYKKALSSKPCKYFKQGKGECPFNDKCFYQHAYPDGRPASPKPRTRRRRVNADEEVVFFPGISLWDFIATRDESIDDFLDEMALDFLDLEQGLFAFLS